MTDTPEAPDLHVPDDLEWPSGCVVLDEKGVQWFICDGADGQRYAVPRDGEDGRETQTLHDFVRGHLDTNFIVAYLPYTPDPEQLMGSGDFDPDTGRSSTDDWLNG